MDDEVPGCSYGSGGCLVRVRAQVMTRDDSTGGWVPLGGGGLSSVSVRKRCDLQPTAQTQPTQTQAPLPPGSCCYQITGEREARVLLSCAIGRDFTYNKVMPTFHHWRAGEHKFGLTFQTSADARAFDKAVRIAMEDLLDDIGDDEVFMTLELPVDSRSSSGSSSAGSGLSPYSANHHLHRINYVRRDGSGAPPSNNHHKGGLMLDESGNPVPPEPYSYVQFAKHDYSYPLVETLKSGVRGEVPPAAPPAAPPPVSGQTPTAPGKKAAPPLPSKARQKRRQCRHCLEEFSEDSNARGACEYAPDSVLSCINTASCISCAHCMLYHCMADAEGDFSQRPCSCSGSPRDCRRRWAGLALLSLLVPCLWCYLPLRACHRAAVSCGLCGGRHQA
ncbi:sprouty-related protein with EVH-1 domain isoform X3 [Haemaphysalis longicornis]